MTQAIQYKSQKQESKVFNLRTAFRRANVENIRVSEFMDEVYVQGEHYLYGNVSAVVKPRGGVQWLALPKELKKMA